MFHLKSNTSLSYIKLMLLAYLFVTSSIFILALTFDLISCCNSFIHKLSWNSSSCHIFLLEVFILYIFFKIHSKSQTTLSIGTVARRIISAQAMALKVLILLYQRITFAILLFYRNIVLEVKLV